MLAAPPPWSANRTWGPHTGSCLAKLELNTLAEAEWGRADKWEGISHLRGRNPKA